MRLESRAPEVENGKDHLWVMGPRVGDVERRGEKNVVQVGKT